MSDCHYWVVQKCHNSNICKDYDYGIITIFVKIIIFVSNLCKDYDSLLWHFAISNHNMMKVVQHKVRHTGWTDTGVAELLYVGVKMAVTKQEGSWSQGFLCAEFACSPHALIDY